MLYLPRNKKLVVNAKNLRKNMTREECHLWFDFLVMYPVRILRQKTIDNYIVDFYCAKARLAIELDGSQHYELANMVRDAERTEKLEQLGIKVMRFTNMDVWNDFEAVKEAIHEAIVERVNG